MTKRKVMITGGAGFIGHHVVEHILKEYSDYDIVIVDKLSYASSGFDRLKDIDVYDNNRDRVKIFVHDFTKSIVEGLSKEIGKPDIIIHMGAESHVDLSIVDPERFVVNNVIGTLRLLEFARLVEPKLFVYFSTDEVYGRAAQGVFFKEGDRHNPGNPYSASKSAAEALCRSFSNSYGLRVNITNTMNVFGERQHPEKFIPMVIRKVLAGEKVIIHSNADRTKAGSRFYIHARNVAAKLMYVIEHSKENIDKDDASLGVFHIVGEKEVDNLELAQLIAKFVGKELKYEMVDFHSSRPGHDLRYAMSGEKLISLGYHQPKSFEDSLQKTVEWTLANHKWLDL